MTSIQNKHKWASRTVRKWHNWETPVTLRFLRKCANLPFFGEILQKDSKQWRPTLFPYFSNASFFHVQLNGSYVWKVLDYKQFYKQKHFDKESEFGKRHCGKIGKCLYREVGVSIWQQKNIQLDQTGIEQVQTPLLAKVRYKKILAYYKGVSNVRISYHLFIFYVPTAMLGAFTNTIRVVLVPSLWRRHILFPF